MGKTELNTGTPDTRSRTWSTKSFFVKLVAKDALARIIRGKKGKTELNTGTPTPGHAPAGHKKYLVKLVAKDAFN